MAENYYNDLIEQYLLLYSQSKQVSYGPTPIHPYYPKTSLQQTVIQCNYKTPRNLSQICHKF